MIRNFEDAIKLKGDERKKEIIERLNDYTHKDLLSICREANSYDGSFDFADAFDLEDLCAMMSAYDVARSIIFGDVTNVDDMVRFDAYGNLESVSEWDLKHEAYDQTDEIADWLMDYWNEAYSLYEDDKELFDAWENIDRYGDDYYDDEDEEE